MTNNTSPADMQDFSADIAEARHLLQEFLAERKRGEDWLRRETDAPAYDIERHYFLTDELQAKIHFIGRQAERLPEPQLAEVLEIIELATAA